MSVNPTELLKNAYGGTFEENIKTVLNKHFNSEIAENLWNQTCEKYSEFLQNHNIPEDDEDAVYYILPSVAVYRVLQNFEAAGKACKFDALSIFREIYFIDGKRGNDYLINRFREDSAFLKGFPQDFLKTVGEGKCEVIADTPEYTEFHVKKCRFVELTKELGCPEICSVFCELDTLMYTDLHPNLFYSREKTLYAGDDCCNFSMRYIGK